LLQRQSGLLVRRLQSRRVTHVSPLIPEPQTTSAGFAELCASSSAKGILPKRWVVERTFAWLARYRRLAGHNPVQAPTSLGSRIVTWFKEVFGSGRREARIFKNDTLNAIKMAYGNDVANLVAQMHKSELGSSSALTGRSTLNLIGTAESLAAKRLHFNVINARKFAEEFVRSTNPGVGGSKRPLTPQERQLVRDVVEEVARNPALMSGTLTKESIFHLANQIQLRNFATTLVPNVPVPTPSTDTSLNDATAGRPRRTIVDNPPLILAQPGVKGQGVRLKFETDLEQKPG
jgi:hypothetical protein